MHGAIAKNSPRGMRVVEAGRRRGHRSWRAGWLCVLTFPCGLSCIEHAQTPLADSPPGAHQDVDALPAEIPGIPWSDGWFDVSVSPDRAAVALIGLPQGIVDHFDTTRIGTRDGRRETRDRVVTGTHVEALPSGVSWAGSASSSDSVRFGSWSTDGRKFASLNDDGHVVIFSRDAELRVLSPSAEQSWSSNPVFDPTGTALAVADALPEMSIPWKEILEAHPDGDLPPRGRLAVLTADGQVARECRLDDLFDDAFTLSLAWSPDGRFIFMLDAGLRTQIRLFDAASLRTLELRNVAWCWAGESTIPQWDPSSRRIVLSPGMLAFIDIDDSGHITRMWEDKQLPHVLRACWSPSGKQLLAFAEDRTPDLREMGETLLGAGHPGSHRTTYTAWFYEPCAHEAVEITEARHIGREAWHEPWMMPRVAEAFAQWTR